MPELRIYQCSRCKDTQTAEEYPENWVHANIFETGGGYANGAGERRDWCAKCWDLIQTPPPSTAHTTYTFQT